LLWWVSVCKCLLVLLNSCCHDWCRQPCNTNRRDSRRGHGRSIGAPAARPRRREPGNAREPLPWRWRQCVARRHAVGGADRWWHLNRVTSQKHNRNCRGFFLWPQATQATREEKKLGGPSKSPFQSVHFALARGVQRPACAVFGHGSQPLPLTTELPSSAAG
jgi:hypothetical protein